MDALVAKFFLVLSLLLLLLEDIILVLKLFKRRVEKFEGLLSLMLDLLSERLEGVVVEFILA